MSLMNYGFTKSKVDENVNEKRSEEKSKPKSPPKTKTIKPAPKSVKEASKDKKNSPSKSHSKKDSKKLNDKSHVKKSSPKKLPFETKKPTNNLSSNTDSSSKMNGIHKLNIKTDNAITSNGGGGGGSGSSSSNNSPKKSPHDVSLPYVRIKMIMKSCPDVEIVPHESLHVITKATEHFIQYLAIESLKSSDSKMLDYEALSNVVHSEDNLEFLKETIPKKITWQECQKLIAANKANLFSET